MSFFTEILRRRKRRDEMRNNNQIDEIKIVKNYRKEDETCIGETQDVGERNEKQEISARIKFPVESPAIP